MAVLVWRLVSVLVESSFLKQHHWIRSGRVGVACSVLVSRPVLNLHGGSVEGSRAVVGLSPTESASTLTFAAGGCCNCSSQSSSSLLRFSPVCVK